MEIVLPEAMQQISFPFPRVQLGSFAFSQKMILPLKLPNLLNLLPSPLGTVCPELDNCVLISIPLGVATVVGVNVSHQQS